MEVHPLSIILVKSDSKGGDRLLFRYPTQYYSSSHNQKNKIRKTPYSLLAEDTLEHASSNSTPSDRVLSNLFAVKSELCGEKFELKVNGVRYVGHPIQFQTGVEEGTGNNPGAPSSILINIVFALHAHASHSIVKCYYDLSKRFGIALRHEEKRSCYMTAQSRDMIAVHDEVLQRQEAGIADESPYELILQRCSLAQDFQTVFDDLCNVGIVHIKVNNWIEVSFCLPHKVHQMSYMKKFIVEPEAIDWCLKSIRPYHGLLLLVDSNQLLESLPPDSSPALARLVHVYSPIKSLQWLAADSDLTLAQVYQLAGHLLYWGKAIVIFPLCSNNVYTVAPRASTHTNSSLVDKFKEKFPNLNLLEELEKFSLPSNINQRLSPFTSVLEQTTSLQTVAWMLQQRLIIQLHTYVYIAAGGPVVENNANQPPPGTDMKLLAELPAAVQIAIIAASALAASHQDINMFCKFYKKGYFLGRHHLEDIMYLENLKRSQLLFLLDKFRDVFLTCEMEDPTISLFYPHYNHS